MSSTEASNDSFKAIITEPIGTFPAESTIILNKDFGQRRLLVIRKEWIRD